jgi:hypothetical protein
MNTLTQNTLSTVFDQFCKPVKMWSEAIGLNAVAKEIKGEPKFLINKWHLLLKSLKELRNEKVYDQTGDMFANWKSLHRFPRPDSISSSQSLQKMLEH